MLHRTICCSATSAKESEMATYADAFSRMGETMLETTRKIAEINVRAGERLLEQQVEMASQWAVAATRNVDNAQKALGFHEFFAGQAQIAQELGQHVLDGWRRSAEIMGEASRQAAEAIQEAGRAGRQEARRQQQPHQR